MPYKPNFLRRVALLPLVFILTFMVLTVFSAATPQTQVSASTISWSSPTTIPGDLVNVVALIRPSDGAFFFIGDSGSTVPSGSGSGVVGGIFIRTNASSFFWGSGNNFATAFRLTNESVERKPSAVFDRNSNLHMVWGDQYATKFHYLRFDATGTLVDQKDIGADVCGVGQCTIPNITTNLAPTAPNELEVGYTYVQPSGYAPYAMSSSDGGATWSVPVGISNLFMSNPMKANKVVLARDGSVYVGFWQSDGAGGWTDNLYVARKPAGGSWGAATRITTNTWGKEFGIGSDAASNAYIVFNGGCATGTKLFVSRYSGGSWSNPTGLNNCSSDSISSISLACTPDGAVWAAISIANAGMRYLHSANGLTWTYGDIWTSNTPGGAFGNTISTASNQVLVGAPQLDGSIGYVTAAGSGVVPTPTVATATNTPVPTNTVGNVTNTPVATNTVGSATNTPVATNTVGNTPLPTNTPVATNTLGSATYTPSPTNTVASTADPKPALTYYAQATATVFAGNSQATATAVAYYATVTARNQNATITALAIPPTATPWSASTTTVGLPTATPYPIAATVRPYTTVVRAATPPPGATPVQPIPTPFPTVTPLPALGVFGANSGSNSTGTQAGNIPALGLALPTAIPTVTPLPTATAVVIVADTGDANGVLRLTLAAGNSDEGIVPLLVRGFISLMITALLYLGWRFIRPQVYLSGRRS